MARPTRLTPSEFHARFPLADWRIVLGQIEALFRCADFGAAAALAQQIAALADDQDHHPDLDLRYPGLVRVALTTHDAHGLTELDAALAEQISALAAAAAATSEPGITQVVEVGIDALDIEAVRPFWRAVLGYVDVTPAVYDDGGTALADPLRTGPAVWFQQMDEPRPGRNRIHLDIVVAAEVAESRVAAALAAGGTLVTDRWAPAFWVLADSEGNEACICTWQGRTGL